MQPLFGCNIYLVMDDKQRIKSAATSVATSVSGRIRELKCSNFGCNICLKTDDESQISAATSVARTSVSEQVKSDE